MKRKIVFDIQLMKPACALLQAAYGGDAALAQHFPLDSWLLFPTAGMHVYEITDEQLPHLVEKVKTAMSSKNTEGADDGSD